MPFWNTLDDGSTLVETDDGRKIRTALDPQSIEANFGATHKPELTLDAGPKADDLAGATAANDAAAPSKLAGFIDDTGDARARDFARGAAPAAQAGPPTDAAGKALVPVQATQPQKLSMPGLQAEQGAQGDPRQEAIGNLLLQQAVTRTAPSKGGWVPRAQTHETENVTPEANLEAIDTASRGADETARQGFEDSVKDYRERILTPELDRANTDLKQLDEAYQRRKAYDSELTAKMKYAEQTEKDAANMPRPSAADDYFKGAGGTFARIIAAISMAAGQYSAAINHTSNAAMQQIQSAIADHGQMLKDQHDAEAEKGRAARNAYSQALQQYGDPEIAMQALNLRGQAIADRMMRVQLDPHLSGDARAAMNNDLAQNEVKRQQLWADAASKAAGKTVSQTAYVPPSAGGVHVNTKLLTEASGVFAKSGEAKTANRSQLAHERAERGTMVRLPPEYAKEAGQAEAFATDEGSAKEMKEQLRIGAGYERAFKDLSDATDNFTSRPITPEKRAKAQGAQAIMTELGKNALGIQTITQYHMPLLHELSGSEATDFWTLGTTEQGKEKVEQARKGLETMKQEHFKQLTRSPDKSDWIVPQVETQ